MSTAAALREDALAKLLEAKALVVDGAVPSEDEPRFEALMGEFREIDAKAAKAQTQADQIGTLEERMQFYTGKATGTPMRFNRTVLDPNQPRSLGDQFVRSQAYADLKASGALHNESAAFKSAPVIADPRLRIGAAATDIIQTESGGPGAGLEVAQFRPGALSLPQRPLTVRDLFSQDTIDADLISYAQQTGFDNAAAAVAQATTVNNGAKPQSSVAWQRLTSPVETIATWMAVTRQALAVEGQMRALIDNQGRLMLGLEEEDQLINGNGTSPNLSGILDQPSAQTLSLAAATSDGDVNIDGIRQAINLVKTGTARATADAIVLHPDDSMEFDLLVDNEGRYRAADPFGGEAGADPTPLWRKRRVESEAVAEGTAIVGAFRFGATVLERQPITVLTSDSHSDFFIRNLVVVLFEERLAFPVYFPTAFVVVTLHSW